MRGVQSPTFDAFVVRYTVGTKYVAGIAERVFAEFWWISRAVGAADMLAFVARRLAHFGEIGFADVASPSHPVTGLSKDQIRAASITAPLKLHSCLIASGIRDMIAFVVILIAASGRSSPNYIIIDILVWLQSDTYLATSMRAVGTGTLRGHVTMAAVTVPAETETE